MGTKLLVGGFISSTLIIVISALVFVFENKLIKSFVTKSVQLIPTNELYKDWLNPPFDIYMKFYLYNLKNGDDFEKNGVKPIFEEIGPFVYKETRIKEDIKDNLNYTITYNDRRWYVFVPELSAYQESFPITTINMAAMTIVNFIKYSPDIEHTVVNEAFKLVGESVIITKTAGEILWGYQDKFLHYLHEIVPNIVNSDIVGLFYGQNDTIYGLNTIYTGVDNINNLGVVERYNHRTTVSNWPTKYANMINGTDGSLSPPFVDKTQRQYAFQSNLCRSLYGLYNGSVTIQDNIELWKIAGNEYIFANASVNPENADFCTPLGNCLGAGVFNLTSCLMMGNIGLPILMSNPHFLFADQRYIDAIEGLSSPDINIHNTVVYVEPLTGIELKANQRLQFNANCINDSRIDATKNITPTVFPLMWLDECFDADNATINKFYYQVKYPLFIINILKYCFIVFGSLIFCISIIYLFVIIKNKRNNSNQNMNTNVNDNTQAPINWIANENTPLLVNNS